MPPFVDYIVNKKSGNLWEADLRSGADECAVAAGRDVLFGGEREAQSGIADEQGGVGGGEHAGKIGGGFGKFWRDEPAGVSKNSGEGLGAAGAGVERDATSFANRRFGDNEQAADAFLGGDGEVGEYDEIWDALIFDGGNDGDLGGASAEGFGALRGDGEGEIVLALQRAVSEAADEWRGVEILHDGDAKFGHGCGTPASEGGRYKNGV